MTNNVEDFEKLLKLRTLRADLAQIAMQQAYSVLIAARQSVEQCQETLRNYAKDIQSEHLQMYSDPQIYAVEFLVFTEVRISRLKTCAEKTYAQLREAMAEEESAKNLHQQTTTFFVKAVAQRDGAAEQFRKINQQAMMASEELQLLELSDAWRPQKRNAR
jgi:hypothetical protein